MMVPAPETARSRGKSGQGKVAGGAALALAGAVLAGAVSPNMAQAELPVPSAGGAIPGFVSAGQAAYQVNGTQALINQVGDKSILNWQSFNVSPGHDVQFRQVDGLATNNLVPGANFTSLNRIWDLNPSVIAGSISQAAGQQANVILVNSNGIAFMGGSQVNLSSFTASSLDIADKFVLDSFLTNNSLTPQFEGTGGFIKVFEGAKITAGSFGRVMLIAPTVVNKGMVEAPDGQVIAAAGTKVFLRLAAGQGQGDLGHNVRGLLVEVDSPDGLADFETANTTVKDGVLDGQVVNLAHAVEDKLGHVTNLGALSTPRGNVTMIGYAVNQHGIARATTSVVANGSVYLLAKDEAVSSTAEAARRGGLVILGAGSVTEVLPYVADAARAQDGRTGGAGLEKASQVWALGQDIRMEGGAVIDAPAGEVNFIAVENPGDLATPSTNPFKTVTVNAPASGTARIHIADGARINVAGLENVQVSAARNSVEVELRGDELKDSPVNQQGPLRGQKVYVDINQALANANSGKSTLITKDSLESYQARLERTVAERSTAGGAVNIRSQGEAILESGAVIDLSGGSVQYTPATVKTTLLTSGGKNVDISDADAETRYDGIATRYVKDYGRWNVKEVIDLGQSFRYDPGYVEGKDAGTLNVIGIKAVQLQADLQGKTVTGELQREAGIQPKGASLTLGSDTVPSDYKLNQRIVIGAATPAEIHALALNPTLFSEDKIANLQIFSNQAAEVREALRLPQGGSVAITAKGVAVNADVETMAGAISFKARDNSVDQVTVPLDVTVADGVTLSARGAWANDLPSAPGHSGEAARVNGGSVSLSAADVVLGTGTLIDVTGGGRVKPDGKVMVGNGGDVVLEAGMVGASLASVRLGGEVRGHALGKGGTFTLNSGKIQIGGVADPAALNLEADFVAQGGFANFNLTGRDGVTVADGVTLTPRVESLELQPGYGLQATGSRIENFSRTLVRDDRTREAANLTLIADSASFGVVKIGEGARILADDGAHVTITAGKRIELQGQVKTAGGNINATLSRPNQDFDPTQTLWLGPQAQLDASGAARTYLDSKGNRIGEVLGGGTVNLNAGRGFIVTAAGATIEANGVAPVRLDVPNEAGGLGRMVGSDAGTISIAAREGVVLDGTLSAQAGSAGQRGGTFMLSLGDDDTLPGTGYPTNERIISLAPVTVVQGGELEPGAAVPSAFNGQARLGADALETAGFERIVLKSRDVVRLEDGLDLGAGWSVPLREIQLDAPRLETAGGAASLIAHMIRLGNYDSGRQDVVNTPTTGTGTFKANAQLLELAGNQTLTGMARTELTGTQEIRLRGISTPTNARPAGALKSAADLALHGALIAPSTYSLYTLDAAGRTIEFTRNARVPVQPLSALGNLTAKAEDIVQDGNLWAPFGQIDLQASNSLVFKDGSLTSVAAAPGNLIPFGKVVNGRAWIMDVDGSKIEIKTLPEKSIRMEAASIDMQAGAKLDLAGGGDLQAYEFTVGPGGSRDILTDKNTYAILPGYASGFAPSDAQESFERSGGDAVYLSGVPGLADGVYTLLPAHYALLPGAYAVKLDTGIQDLLPGQAYSRQDGVRVAAGYVTDSRANAPRDAGWQGIQVLTRDQVRARSEITLTHASEFFAEGKNRPQDAGLLSIVTTGTGSDSLKLDAVYKLDAGSGGRGAAVDISALKLAITSGAPSGIDSDVTQIDVDKLNALGAESLFIGGTRSVGSDATTLAVGADSVMLANNADHALQAPEVILAAKDTLTLKSGSLIDAQGPAQAEADDAVRYESAGEGALVRAAATPASFTRTASPPGILITRGTLVGEAGSKVIAADAITLDATRDNAFKGVVEFNKEGAAVAGNLAVGATRINFGAAPTGSEGITYSQAGLDALNSLESMVLTSYSTFDLYGDVNVGGVDINGKPTLQNLTLQGAGLAGFNNSGQTANLRAQNLMLANPAAAAYTLAPGGAPGDGTLAILADTLTLGEGDKAIQGYGNVTITANEMLGEGVGKTNIAASTMLNVARISGERGANQTLTANGALTATKHIADRALAPVNALGARWALAGTSVDFNTQAVLPSGQFKLTATGGDVTLGADARVDVAGRSVQFFDVSRPTWGGTAKFVSETGNVTFAAGSKVDVSAAPGSDAGKLIVHAAHGTATLADGSVQGNALPDAEGNRGDGARFDLDVNTLASFSALNTVLNQGEFDGARSVRVRTGDLNVAASDSVKAHDIKLAADSGALTVQGELNADGREGGSIQLYSGGRLTLADGAKLSARALQAGRDGGTVTLGSTDEDTVLAGGSIDTAGAAGGQDGTVLIRASRTDDTAFTHLYAPLPDTGTANNYKVSLKGVTAASSLLRGLVVSFVPKFTNKASSKLSINNTAAKDIWYNGAVVKADRIKANETVYMVYDGTRFNIVDAPFANRTASAVPGTSTSSRTTTTYVVSQPGFISYKPGQTVVYTPDADNTATINKLNVNGLGAKDIKYNNVNLAAGFLKAGEPVYLVYDGTAFQVALEANTPRAVGTATALAVTATRELSAGDSYAFVAGANSDAGGTTLTLNGVTAPLLKNGADLAAADIKSNNLVYVTYDGAAFHLLTELAAKVDVGQGVRVTSVAGDYTKAIGTSITGASSIVVEAVRTYDALTVNGGGVLDANRLSADAYRYLPKAERDNVKATLVGATPAFDATKFHLRPGTEIQYTGNIAMLRDINLADYRYGGEPGVLTVRAAGNLDIQGNLSDGFNVATSAYDHDNKIATALVPADLLGGESWSYRLIAGADHAAADPLAVRADVGDVTLAAGKLIRTGTGDIYIASGKDIKLADNKAAIYTAGRLADPQSGFTAPTNISNSLNFAQFSQNGGNVSLTALNDIVGKPSAQLYSNWLFRQGKVDAATGQYTLQPAWWVRFDQFQQGIGALGGGDVSMNASGKIENVSASTPTQARMAATAPDASQLVTTGGGDVRVETGGDLLGGQYYADLGEFVIKSGGTIASGQGVGSGASAKPLYTILALGDVQAQVQAQGELDIHALINPHLVVQSSGAGANVNVGNPGSALWSLFSTYGEDSAASLLSLGGAVNFRNAPGGSQTLASIPNVYKPPLNFSFNSSLGALVLLPANLNLVSFQDDVLFGGSSAVMRPAARGDLNLLAAGTVSLSVSLNLTDMAPMPDAIWLASNTNGFSPAPLHSGDFKPAVVYAVAGDVAGVGNKLNLTLAKAVNVRAGRDVIDLGISAQHPNADDVSRVEAGRDVLYSTSTGRNSGSYIWVAGSGRLEVVAGRNIDLGTSAGIVSRGNLDNPALPVGGADIHVAAGVGAGGIDYQGAVNRLIAKLEAGTPDDATLWQGRWLTGDISLSAADVLTRVIEKVGTQDANTQRARVRDMLFTALRTTGRDFNDPASPFAGDYARGYAALETVFPGIREQEAEGTFKNYQGDINLFASRIITERGGDIEFITPGGQVVVGLGNTPAALLQTEVPGSGIGLKDSGVLGMATVADGSIRGIARGDILVNQSRILTVGGGDVLLWSSEGDIDAGKGKKTATSVPPPLTLIDSQGNVTQVLQGAASGSGIGALIPVGGRAGDVDLIAPTGTVNAGDAGIRAGNLNIAAQVVLGADNISVSGTATGTPVADTRAVTATSSGAVTAGDDVSKTTAALSQNLADATRAAEQLKQAFKPSFVSVEVVGFGE
jgi:filamentous hemagglutinin family protein